MPATPKQARVMTCVDRLPRSGPEPGLFVLWSDARPQQRRILSTIGEQFEIRRVMRVQWTPQRVDENYARFYRGQTSSPFSSVFSDQKGRDAFTLALVIDPAPKYELRDTTRGRAVVNANMLDAKQRFREWTGGGMRVHGTDTAAEANRDTLLLLGEEPSTLIATAPTRWDGTIDLIERDLTGARGWASLRELFGLLNHSINYVVLRNFENLPDDVEFGDHTDVDILTDDYPELIRLLNARPVVGGVPKWGGRFLVTIGDHDVIFDLRFVGDDYYDARWAQCILDDRRVARSVQVPSDVDYFESLAYHAVVHKRQIADDYRDRLARMASTLGRPGWQRARLDDDRTIATLVRSIVEAREFSYVRPRDITVFFNYANVGANHPWLRRKIAGVGREVTRRGVALTSPLTYALRVVRQRIIAKLPWLRELRASPTRAVLTGTRARSQKHLAP